MAKKTSFNYRQAVSKARQDPLRFRRDRALRKLRPRYSADRFLDLTTAISQMEFHELIRWLDEVEATWT